MVVLVEIATVVVLVLVVMVVDSGISRNLLSLG